MRGSTVLPDKFRTGISILNGKGLVISLIQIFTNLKGLGSQAIHISEGLL